MANIQSISHKKSAIVENGGPKLPTTSQLELGEIAINFADGYETLSIKNNNNEIVTFTNDNYWINKEHAIAAALNDLNNKKQDVLELDEVPTEGSENVVTSGGLYSYITEIEQATAAALNNLNSNKQDTLEYDEIPTEGSENPVTSGGLYNYITEIEEVVSEALNDLNDRKQDILDIDTEPILYSANPISSNAIFEMSKVVAASLNDLNLRKANISDVLSMIEEYGLSNLADVATSGSYLDLTDTPNTTVTLIATTGTQIATVGGVTLYAPDATVTLIVTSGTEIALVGNTSIYAPNAAVNQILTSGVEIAQVGNTSIYSPDDTIYEINHGTSDTVFTLTPGTMHIWGEVASLDLSLPQDTNNSLDEYLFTFTCPSNASTILSLPVDVKWIQEPDLLPGKTYQVSIINGLAGYVTDNMETGGDENIIEEIQLNGTSLIPDSNKAVDITAVTSVTVNGSNYTPNANGLVDLGTISGGSGDVNVIESVKVNGTALTVTNKAVDITAIPASIVTQDATYRMVSDTEKSTWNGKQDALSNATVLSGITSTKVSNWDSAATNSHTHSNKTVLDGISSTDITNWNSKTDNIGTVTGVKMNGTTNNPTNGVVDLGTVLTSFTETDPTVPAWAKAANKPTYTASEVGALPASTVIPSAPGTLNTTATTAQSTNSSEALSGNITLHKVAKTGTYSDLIGKPTNLSSFTDDLGSNPTHTHSQYLTSAPVTSVNGQTGAVTLTLGDANVIEAITFNGTAAPIANKTAAITYTAPVTSVNNKTGVVVLNSDNIKYDTGSSWQFFGDGDSLSTCLENLDDAITDNYVTYDSTNKRFTVGMSGSPANLVTAAQIVTDGGGITSHQSIKTINNNTITGTGNVSVGTITGITMNGASKGTSGVVDLGTVITSETSLSKGTTSGNGNAITDISVSGHTITLTKGSTFLTSHQDISGKADDNLVVHKAGNETITGNKIFQSGTTTSFDGDIEIGQSYIRGTQNQGDFDFIVSNDQGTDRSLQDVLNSKQATLVSGTNIKTINGTSILGSGNIALTTIYSGSSTPSSSLGSNGDIYIKTS